MRAPLLVAAVFAAVPALAWAQPVPVEPGWVLTSSIALTGARSARFNPIDGLIYVGTKGNANDGLYRISRFGRLTRVVSSGDAAGLAIEPDGDVYFTDDVAGIVYRVAFGTTTRQQWAATFHTGDDDPTGLAIAPANHSGVITPGRGVTADQGFNGLDEIWTFTTTVASTPRPLHTDVGTLIAAVDVVVGASDVFITDTGEAAPGAIYRVLGNGTLVPVTTQQAIADPGAIALDPLTQELLVADAATDRLLRINPGTGAISEVITGLPLAADEYAGIGTKADGRQLFLTAGGVVYVFTQCATVAGGADDCNNNGLFDLCDLASGAASDCNQNQRPDACDVTAVGGSNDCNFDLVPDECPRCGPVEVVFVMDTSASMDDEAAALCADLQSVTDELQAGGITLLSRRLGISDNPGGAYACLTSHVIAQYGTAVPGNPPPDVAVLGGMCTGVNEAVSEDWGRATAIVAGRHAWAPGAARLVVPIADEGPWCGNPVLDPGNDRSSITHASTVAVANDVFVSPITGTGSSQAVVTLAQALATATGGRHHASTAPNVDVATAILETVRDSCAQIADCNGNGIPDNCDVAGGASRDCDADGVPDECQRGVTCADAGVPDASARDAAPIDAGATADGGVVTSSDAAVLADAGNVAPDATSGDDAASASDDDASASDDAATTAGEDAMIAAGDASATKTDAAPAVMADAAGPARDSGGGTDPEDEGCGCRSTRDPGSGAVALLLVVGWISMRRRTGAPIRS